MQRATRIVGRDQELDWLAGAVERTRDGFGGVVAITGPAGVGKSALVRHGLGLAADVVVGRATPPPNPPAQPLADLALGLLRRGADPTAPGLRLHRGALRVLLPSVDLGTGSTERPTPMHLVDALVDLSTQLEQRRPHVLVMEDLHWADELTYQAVEHVADRLGATSLLLIVTARPNDRISDLVSRLCARHAADHFELHPLPDARVVDLVEHCLEGNIPSGLFDALAVAAGAPLQIEELLLAYERSGALHAVDGVWRFEPSSGPVPKTVLDATRLRLAELTDDDRQVIRVAALLGRRFDATVVATALGLRAAVVDDSLRAAIRCGVLVPEPGALRPWFAHELVRDAVIVDTGETTRRQMASQLLKTMDVHGNPEDAERTAALAVLAGDEARAADAYTVSGRYDLARGLPANAVQRFDAAIALTRSAKAALPIREALLRALALSGDVTRARAEADVVQRQLAAADAEPERLAAATVAAARAAANAAAWDEAERLLSAIVSGADHPSADAQALGALVALERADLERAGELARAVIVRRDALPEQRCEAFETLGRLARRHDLAEATKWFDQAIATAELADLDLWAARAVHERATIAQLRSLDVAGLYAARERAAAAGAPGLSAAVDFHLAAVHGVRFEPEPALDAARRVLDAARRLGAARQEGWAWNLIGQAHAAGGDRARANAASGEALDLAGDDDEVAAVAIGTARGLASLLADDRDRGLAELTEGVRRLRCLPSRVPLPPWYLWPLVATVYDLEGDGGAAARAETDDPALRMACSVNGIWHLADAVARGQAGDTVGAEAAVRLAEERFADAPGFAGYAHVARRFAAEPAIAAGWGEPAVWLGAAEAWAAQRGHPGMRAACASLGRKAGVPQRRRRRGGAEVPASLAARGITSREVDVLLLLVEGLTNAEIADRLYLSPRTIKGYVENLLAKTGAANRTQLAAIAADAS